jgi:uncharacterized protein (TIGR03086 family)
VDAVSQLDRAHDVMHMLLANLPKDALDAPTPCDGYDVHALLNHVIGGAQMFALCASGQPVPHDDPTDDLVGADPVASWDDAAASSSAAWRRAGVLDGEVTLPFATLPGVVALNVALAETVIHAWDVARASQQSTRFPDDLAQLAFDIGRQIVTDDFRGPETFGPECAPPPGAHVADQLAAFAGRQV